LIPPGGTQATNPLTDPPHLPPTPTEAAIAADLSATDPSANAQARARDRALEAATRERLHMLHSQTYCRKGAIIIATTSPIALVIVPTRCKTWGCPTCGPILANLWAQRISHAKPQRFITLTCQKDRFPQPYLAYEAMKAALPQLVRFLRKKVGQFQYCAIWETHESGWPHLHLVQKGVYIPAKLLKAKWEALGIGYNCDIRSVTTTKGAARYASKYMTKTIAEGKRALGITKVIQYSRNFFPRTLLHPKLHDVNTTDVLYTRRHPAEVLQLLIQRFGYQIDPHTGGYGFRLIPGTSKASETNLYDILALLYS